MEKKNYIDQEPISRFQIKFLSLPEGISGYASKMTVPEESYDIGLQPGYEALPIQG